MKYLLATVLLIASFNASARDMNAFDISMANCIWAESEEYGLFEQFVNDLSIASKMMKASTEEEVRAISKGMTEADVLALEDRMMNDFIPFFVNNGIGACLDKMPNGMEFDTTALNDAMISTLPKQQYKLSRK